jgi:hypothetical protein
MRDGASGADDIGGNRHRDGPWSAWFDSPQASR